MKALHGVLTRANMSLTPYHDGWTWNDAVKAAPDGSQTTCWLWGLEAIVTAAAMLTADACGWVSGPLGELEGRCKRAAAAEHLIPWLREKAEVLCRMLSNMSVIEKEGVGYGASMRSNAPAQAVTSIERLLSLPANAELEAELEALRSALAALAPRPVIAGFYRPGAAGPIAQFLLHLREDGLSYDEIALIMNDLQPPESYPTVGAYQRRRASVVDAVKHRINGEKAKLRRNFGNDSVLGYDSGAQILPRQDRWVVLVSIRVEAFSEATIHI